MRASTRLGVAIAIATLSLMLPLSTHAGCQIQTLELPVKLAGSRAIATVGINGTLVPLTVDSGAFFSMLTEAAASQLELPRSRNRGPRVKGLTGWVDTYITRVDKLQLIKGEIPRVEFIVGGNEPGAGTMGLMGRNILSFTDTEYDLAHGVIRFVVPNGECATSNLAYWAGSLPVTELDLVSEFRNDKTPAIRTHVKLNGVDLVALFDTGATTAVSTQAAKRAGITDADLVPRGRVYGAGQGSAKLWTTFFEKLEIGGETISHNRLMVADIDLQDADMLLGIDFFLSHRIYVSKQQSKMFLTYGGGAVFALDKGEVPVAVPIDADVAASDVGPISAEQLARRGAASAARHDYESALADLNRSCELDPTSAALFAQRAVIQQALKRPAKALEDLDKALEFDPTLAEARSQRASLRFRAKNLDGAKADLDMLDKTLAHQAQLRLFMSRLYLSLDQPAEALTQLNQWLASHPHEVRRDVALNSRCWIRARMGIELDEALEDCDDAIDSDPKNPEYLDSRGWVYLRLRKYKNALADFDRSVASRSTGAWSLYGRGLAKTYLGDVLQGDVDLAAARKVQPDIDVQVEHAGLKAPS